MILEFQSLNSSGNDSQQDSTKDTLTITESDYSTNQPVLIQKSPGCDLKSLLFLSLLLSSFLILCYYLFFDSKFPSSEPIDWNNRSRPQPPSEQLGFQCPHGKFILKSLCLDACPPSHSFSFHQDCLQICPVSLYIDNNQCVENCSGSKVIKSNRECAYSCDPGFKRYQNKCFLSCPPSTLEYMGNCFDSCPEHYIVMNGKCVNN